ncbi:type IA DNA topoisomerase [Dysgonomonas termitidis]|uniref:DNA topoisomerase n=1 Tax=Dysgonomonas termitidis TaxID=1516126 RepID=A0ABV9L2Z1_9BACT
MIAIITEKPSVGQDIARVLNITEKKNGYMQGNGYMLTWAFGHLITLAYPEDYGIDSYNLNSLPILPEPFKLIPRKTKTKKGYQTDGTAKKQLDVIKSVFSGCDRIIVATDAGREGELIFRYIYNYLKCKKPFSRLWISSLTDNAIKEGFRHLKDGTCYDSIYLSAEARSKADWLMGINASRALCICSGDGNNSLGRVQTPTLAIICKRYLEVLNFKPEPYWQPVINVQIGESPLYINTTSHYLKKEDAESIYQFLKTYSTVKVERIEKKTNNQQPPLLHDLTSLQKEANKCFSMTADTTLNIAQKLYEAKLISYPRTGSRYIPKDIFEKIPELIDSLKEHPDYKNQAKLLSAMKTKLNMNTVDDKKITDHHALIITENKPAKLIEDEKKIYGLIAQRMLEAFAGVCKKSIVDIGLACDDIKFHIKQTSIEDKGWTNLFGADPDNRDESGNIIDLSSIKEGDYLQILGHNLVEKKTKPKALYNDSSLLGAMEACGKDIEDEEARKAIKDVGIGTPATRASIIETLMDRGYTERDNKNIIPTKKGLDLYKAIKLMRIADVEMTGGWESGLAKIEVTPDYYNSFMGGILIYTKQVVDEITSVIKAENTKNETPYVCPRCRLGKVTFYNKVIKCNYSKCNLTLYRELCGKKLTDNQLKELFRTGKSPLIKGFNGKNGKAFDAYIKFDSIGNFHFSFPDKENRIKK